MLVYGSLVIGGMVFLGYDSGFQRSLAIFRCHGVGMFMVFLGYDNGFQRSLAIFQCHGVGMFISVFELWNCQMDFRS